MYTDNWYLSRFVFFFFKFSKMHKNHRKKVKIKPCAMMKSVLFRCFQESVESVDEILKFNPNTRHIKGVAHQAALTYSCR